MLSPASMPCGGIIQRRHGLRSPPSITSLVRAWTRPAPPPRRCARTAGTFRSDPAQRMQMRCGPCTNAPMPGETLLQMTAAVYGTASVAAHLDDPAVIDADVQAAGVGTIKGADARALIDGHWISFRLRAGVEALASALEPADLNFKPAGCLIGRVTFVPGAVRFPYAMSAQRYRSTTRARAPMYSQGVVNKYKIGYLLKRPSWGDRRMTEFQRCKLGDPDDSAAGGIGANPNLVEPMVPQSDGKSCPSPLGECRITGF